MFFVVTHQPSRRATSPSLMKNPNCSSRRRHCECEAASDRGSRRLSRHQARRPLRLSRQGQAERRPPKADPLSFQQGSALSNGADESAGLHGGHLAHERASRTAATTYVAQHGPGGPTDRGARAPAGLLRPPLRLGQGLGRLQQVADGLEEPGGHGAVEQPVVGR